jgi:selenocysteine-specific elongation factor
MVAGATGLDLVCLVIAADEGVMPQTREHLDICELLGVRRGLVALTKRDLVDDEWLAMVTADVAAEVAGTFLAGAPVVACSTRSGAGLDELRATLAAAVDQVPPREATGVFRLPIDRVFTVKGFGTIVTGTVLGGAVALGDELAVLPGGVTARVRGIEVHGAAVERAVAGHRAAINLGGIAVDDLARGDLLTHPGRVAASHILDVEFRHLATAPGPLGPRTKVLVHHGTAQVLASLVLVDHRDAGAGDPDGPDGGPRASAPRGIHLAPGDTALAQLRIAATTPLGALPGDRFIVRGFVATATHGTTIGGGRVIRVLAPRARKGSTHGDTVARLAAARHDQRLALDIKTAAFAGLGLPDLVRRTGVPGDVLAPVLATLIGSGELLALGAGDHAHYLHATAVAELEGRILKAVAAGPEGVLREELRTHLPSALPVRAYDAILAGLERKAAIASDGDRVRKASAPGRGALLTPAEAKLADQFRTWALEPPRPKDIPAELRLPEPQVKTMLDRLIAGKQLIRVKPDLYVHADAIGELRTRLIAFLDAHKTIDAQQWKELTGASRKFSIPLAEYFDAERITLRVGDVRRRR